MARRCLMLGDVSAPNGMAMSLDEVSKRQLLDIAVRALRCLADRVEVLRDSQAYREIPDLLDELEVAARALDEALRASL
jgi:hypothetical protein